MAFITNVSKVYSSSGEADLAMTISKYNGSKRVKVYGDFSVTGEKKRVLKTLSYDERQLYCYEMTSPMFGDAGEAVMDENGECYIYLDDIFAETVTAEIEYQVFLQKEGDGDIWIEEKNPVYFFVRGTENLKFAWEIKAKQKGYEFERLETPPAFMEVKSESGFLLENEMENYIKGQEKLLYETT